VEVWVNAASRPARAAAGMAAVVVAALVAPTGAGAAFPGANGPIAFENFDEGLVVVNPDGAGRRALNANGSDPFYGPGGARIAFLDGGLNVSVMNADGSGVRRVRSGTALNPAFSPNGKQIVFLAGGDIYVIDVDGTDQAEVTDGPAEDPSFSPSGERIVFAEGGKIKLVDPDGSNEVTLAGSGGVDLQPSFSPDGQRIAFTVPGEGVGSDIYAMDSDGQNADRLTFGGDTDSYAQPAFSPDGTKIVYSTPDGLWTIDAEGGEPNPLTSNASDEAPNWGAAASLPARLAVRRAQVRGGRLHVRGRLARASAGERVAMRYRAGGRVIRLRARADDRGRFDARRKLRPGQRDGGLLRLRFGGNLTLRRAAASLRVARRPVGLRLAGSPRLRGGRLVVAGRAGVGGRVRVRTQFNRADGAPRAITETARIRRSGAFRLERPVPAAVRDHGAFVSVTHRGRGARHGQRVIGALSP